MYYGNVFLNFDLITTLNFSFNHISSINIVKMKPQSIVFGIALSVLCFCNYSSVYSQFKDAVVADIATGMNPVFATNTGNFILDNAGVNFMVSVWDDMGGTNAALAWKVGAATGLTLIDPTANIKDPDVCIVKNNFGSVFAIVSYFEQNSNQFMMRVFNWQSGLQQFTGQTPIVLIPGQYETTINIDANDEGDFVIVWDQLGQQVQMVFGTTTGNNPPTLNFQGAAFNLNQGTMPDVCFFRNGTTGYKQVDVVYKNPIGVIAVDFYRFTDLLGGIVNAQTELRSAPADLIYRYPRIDCPSPAFGNQSEYTVVVEDSDNSSTWLIKSFNKSVCCPGITTNIYNDGNSSNSPYNLSDVGNTKPVVAYQNNPLGITIGWNFDNSFGLLAAPGASVARYPVAMSCTRTGGIFPASAYLVIPIAVNNGAQIGNLSLSGRLSPEGLYSYLKGNEIYFKSVPHAVNSNSLKTVEPSNFSDWVSALELENASFELLFTVTDMTGKQVFAYTGPANNLYSKWNSFSKNIRMGVYSAQSNNNEGKLNFNGKLFVSND